MTRPLYETQEQRDFIYRVVERIAEKHGVRFFMTPTTVKHDAVLVYQKKTVKLEVKGRQSRWKPLIMSNGFMLSSSKWDYLIDNKPSLLVVAFDYDDLYEMVPESKAVAERAIGGRTIDTRDAYDIEEVVYISWDKFQKIT